MQPQRTEKSFSKNNKGLDHRPSRPNTDITSYNVLSHFEDNAGISEACCFALSVPGIEDTCSKGCSCFET